MAGAPLIAVPGAPVPTGGEAAWFTGADGNTHFGVGVGTIVLLLNATLLGCYTFGCHVARHQIGGYLDRLSGAPIRKRAYDCVSCMRGASLSRARDGALRLRAQERAVETREELERVEKSR